MHQDSLPSSTDSRSRAKQPVPLCVDLDGTLVLSDLLLESILRLIRLKPTLILLLPLWLLRGRAAFKEQLAAHITLDPQTLPYNLGLIRWLKSERDAGRSLWLCTASNAVIAARIAAHTNIFDGVFASDHQINLAGKQKALLLVRRFGECGFDYCGNEWRDVHIWKHARNAIVVRGNRRLLRKVASISSSLLSFPRDTWALTALVKALRPHQWTKNLLLIVPLAAAHRLDDVAAITSALVAIAAFSLCASSAYVINDLLDLEADRAHPKKCTRPFASGELSVAAGAVLAPVLLAAGFALGALISSEFLVILLAYCTFTLIYSFALKGVVLLDVLSLALLYTLRILAGGATVGVPLSFWLLLFSIFIFLSLAFVKRFAELSALDRRGRLRAAGRDYSVSDLPMLQSLGSTAGYLSIIVLALYINSPEVNVLYRSPSVMWLLCVLLLYWISRVWITAQRGGMDEDPVIFALEDRASRIVLLLSTMVILLAI